MEAFTSNYERMEIGAVLTHHEFQPVAHPAPGNNQPAYIEFADNSRLGGTVRHREGNFWNFETPEGVWVLELTGKPILKDKMRMREFTVRSFEET
ncbi:hypothetical protein [Sagittula stellata]|nr:hypothetical protein [Sagittula stellata]